MLDWTNCQAVERNSEKLDGAWVFRGSRVPVSALFENLISGASLDQFLAWFPGVTRDQAEEVIRHAARSTQIIELTDNQRAAIIAYNEHVEKHGVFSDGLRSF
jgi:uncharacterized protein (DUF433 family)